MESHFDLSAPKDENKRKVGRPFKGQVEEYTREPHVPERRSILRGFKKFYSKREFEDIIHLHLNGGSSYYPDIYNSLGDNDLKNVQNYMNICRQTQSADHFRKKIQG